MIRLNMNNGSDPEFIGIVSNILNACIDRYHPADVYVVEIDHWFDWKWQRFSVKILGALGTGNRRLVVPPFDPQRVASQQYYQASAQRFYHPATKRPLHKNQTSAMSTSRYLAQVSESGLFLWYSGETVQGDQASILLYQIDATGASDWYASFSYNTSWTLNGVSNIPSRVFEDMMTSTATLKAEKPDGDIRKSDL